MVYSLFENNNKEKNLEVIRGEMGIYIRRPKPSNSTMTPSLLNVWVFVKDGLGFGWRIYNVSSRSTLLSISFKDQFKNK